MGLLRKAVKHALTATLPARLLLVRGRRPRRSDQAAASPADCVRISLTFDDGPHPEHTPRVLDRLAAAGATGTFFVVGEKVMRHPQLLKRLVSEGHEVGNHTFSHGDPDQTTADEFLNEARETRELVGCLTGYDVRLVRPPKGALTLAKLLGLWREGQTVVLWNVDPKDFRMRTVLQMDHWLEHYEPADGDIVLLHDSGPLAELVVRELTAGRRFQNVRLVPVSYWLGEADESPPEERSEDATDRNAEEAVPAGASV